MGEELAVLTVLRCASGGESAAVDPDHDGERGGMFGRGLGGAGDGCPDVEGETVLAGAGVVEDHIRVGAELDAVVAEVAGEEDVLPLGRGLRRTPAQIADRRRGVGNTLVGDDFLVGGENAEELAAGDLDGTELGRLLRGGCRGGEEESQGADSCAVHSAARMHGYVSDGKVTTGHSGPVCWRQIDPQPFFSGTCHGRAGFL